MNKTIIPIFFSIDDNYSKLLEIAMQSIISNASTKYNYNIHILHNGLSEESKNRLIKFNNKNFQIFFEDMIKKVKNISNKLFTRDYYSKTTYYRLFIPNMFPNYKKALYLDADIVVTGDISELYNFDLKNNLIGAVPDESVQTVEEFILYVEKYLGIDHEKYFNAGILSMNLDELRLFDFENKFLSLLSQIKFIVAQDQDYLNAICKDRVEYLPTVWDKMPFPNDEIKKEDIKLIHYNLTYKPWHYDNILYEEYFYKYAEELGLTDYVKECKNKFTEKDKEIDQLGGQNLIKLTLELSQVEDTYVSLLESGKIKI